MSVALNPYQIALNERLRRLPLAAPPQPWELQHSFAVGGLIAAGFSADSRYLVLVSHSGRGVVDLATMSLVGRDREEPSAAWFDPCRLQAEGIGPLAGQQVAIAGIHGGGLPTMTTDLWKLDLVAPDWPLEWVVLSGPGSSPYIEERSAGSTRVAPRGGGDEIRCFGFTRAGRHFVVATSADAEVFGR
jgi:hypothetical protein